jgi:hypothetical protein
MEVSNFTAPPTYLQLLLCGLLNFNATYVAMNILILVQLAAYFATAHSNVHSLHLHHTTYLADFVHIFSAQLAACPVK